MIRKVSVIAEFLQMKIVTEYSLQKQTNLIKIIDKKRGYATEERSAYRWSL